MPVPSSSMSSEGTYPSLSRKQVDAARTSAWYRTFRDITPSTSFIDVDKLGERDAFLEWIESDSIFLPHDSQLLSVDSSTVLRSHSPSASSSSSSSSTSPEAPTYHLPNITEAIRAAIKKQGGSVFPKLNWTAPKDAAFILPQTAHGPLYCISPADVYLLLKSSDFISHDLDIERVYAGCNNTEGEQEQPQEPLFKVELVLRRFVDMNPSREMRCFVRNGLLIGISQRDLNFYDHLQAPETKNTIRESIKAFWESEIRDHYAGGPNYVFDVYLSANLSTASLIDFQPYKSSTDPLLFTYEDLRDALQDTSSSTDASTTDLHTQLPELRTIDSRSHPHANRNAPAFQSNMVPLEMLQMSEGRHMGDFKTAWDEAVAAGMRDDE